MSVVFEYAIQNREGYQRVFIPESAKIIRCKLERDTVLLWAIVDQDEKLQQLAKIAIDPIATKPNVRTFSIEMTGWDRPWIKPENYVGSYEYGPYVLHVFEVKR